MTETAGDPALHQVDHVQPGASVGGWRRGWAAPTLVFFSSAAVLILEILAGRLVAPYVGVSLETYTGIIGTVLAGIAAGSWGGGWLADRRDPATMIGPVLIVAGASALLSLPVITALGPEVSRSGGGPGGIVLLAASAFVLPTALLSAVSPMAAKLRLTSMGETGAVVGGLSAAGTAGALLGTFLTGFVLVAEFPTRAIVTVVGGLVVVTGIAISVGAGRRPRAAALMGVAFVAVLSQAGSSPCQEETTYFCVAVMNDPQRASGRVLLLDDVRHSYVDLNDATHLEFRYSRLFAHVIDSTMPPGAVDALHIGGGGFTLPRWLAATRPGTFSTVLELDAEIVTIAEQRLGLVTGPMLQVRTGDARQNIGREPAGAYDVVLGDAFGGISVPWHLTTTEMIERVERVLRPTGVYVLNVIDGSQRRLVRAELASLRAVFDHVAVIVPPGDGGGNHVLVASNAPISIGAVDPQEGRLLDDGSIDDFIGSAQALRDDRAPVDQLLTRN